MREQETRGCRMIKDKIAKDLVERDIGIAKMVFNNSFRDYKYEEKEMVAKAVVKLWYERLRFKSGEESYISYARKICYNTFLNYIRDITLRKHLSFDTCVEKSETENIRLIDTYEAEQNLICELIDIQPLIGGINETLKHMKSKARKIILLYLKHYRYDEIAHAVGISRSNVCGYIKRFRNEMEKFLTEDEFKQQEDLRKGEIL